MARIVYRDSKTGRFAKRATWERSKAQGGTRYVRKRIVSRVSARPSTPSVPVPVPERVEPEELERELEEGDVEEIELVGGFDSPGRKRR